MSLDNNCFYCMKGEDLTSKMIEICKLKVSTLYLFREQSNRGRVVVVFDGHETEMFRLNEEERNAFMNDICTTSEAVFEAMHPGKLNYGVYGDKLPHLHVHIVPKCDGGESWGVPFALNPRKTYLTDDEYKKIIDMIKSKL